MRSDFLGCCSIHAAIRSNSAKSSSPKISLLRCLFAASAFSERIRRCQGSVNIAVSLSWRDKASSNCHSPSSSQASSQWLQTSIVFECAPPILNLSITLEHFGHTSARLLSATSVTTASPTEVSGEPSPHARYDRRSISTPWQSRHFLPGRPGASLTGLNDVLLHDGQCIKKPPYINATHRKPDGLRVECYLVKQ